MEKEAGSISQDQRFYADYLCGVKEFKPWMESAESHIKEPLPKPSNLAECLALLGDCQVRESTSSECGMQRVNVGIETAREKAYLVRDDTHNTRVSIADAPPSLNLEGVSEERDVK